MKKLERLEIIYVIIKKASVADVKVIHQLMILAYTEYKVIPGSSTALDESEKSVKHALATNEHAYIAYENEIPIAAVRYELRSNELFFSRLSVHPAHRGKGLARRLIKKLEETAKEKDKQIIGCKVRMDLTRNMDMYRAYGYKLCDQFVEVVKGLNIDVAKMEKVLT